MLFSHMKRFLPLIIACLCLLGSCGVLNKAPQVDILNLKVFQTLSKTEALARTSDFDVVKVIILDDLVYDGKEYSGVFVLVDTYTYTTREDIQKTVPVYMRRSDYRKINKRK